MYAVDTYLDITELEGDIINLISDEEKYGDDIINVIENTISEYVCTYFSRIGIILDRDILFSKIYYLVMSYNTVLDLEATQTYELDLIITDDEGSLEEKLALMLSSYSPITQHQYLNFITDADYEVFVRLQIINESKRSKIVIKDDDMSIVNVLANIDKDYNNTLLVQSIRNNGYSGGNVCEYLEDMYRYVNTHNNLELAAKEIATTFYIGEDSRHNMIEYFELYFNRSVVNNQTFDSNAVIKQTLVKINEIKTRAQL
jgi:hypothetical protein